MKSVTRTLVSFDEYLNNGVCFIFYCSFLDNIEMLGGISDPYNGSNKGMCLIGILMLILEILNVQYK